jgi:hypothetical protein
MVHHITPGRADKNFGKAINQIIENLPDNDWICLRDIDTMPLHHRIFFKQCEDIANENKADLIGCMTNRIGVGYQLHNGKISDNYNLKNHYQIAIDRYNQYNTEIDVLSNSFVIAGIFMLFSKKTWLKVDKFKEGGIFVNNRSIDYLFSEAVYANGLKTGIAKGIYIWHTYRDWITESRTVNVRMEHEHLK